MRRFFGALSSPCSGSPASLFVPVAAAPLGVSGGVVMGTPVTLPELAAVMPGTLPEMRCGFVLTAVDDCVAIDEAEFVRVGEAGRCVAADEVAGGDGAVKELAVRV